jgi:hypothetical protein
MLELSLPHMTINTIGGNLVQLDSRYPDLNSNFEASFATIS